MTTDDATTGSTTGLELETPWSPNGDLTVMDFQEIKARLLVLLQGQNKEINLDLSQVNNVDVSIVQMLYSFHLSCVRCGKLLSFSNPSATLLKRMDQIGMSFPWNDQ